MRGIRYNFLALCFCGILWHFPLKKQAILLSFHNHFTLIFPDEKAKKCLR